MSGPDEILVESARVADALSLIDAFRGAGLDAGLAESPGTWDVVVRSADLGTVTAELARWMRATGRELMLAHDGALSYLVSEPAVRVGEARIAALR